MPERRTGMPQIVIEPVEDGFAVLIDGQTVRFSGDELDAHHWGKHAFEAVNRGLRSAGEIGRAMPRLCIAARQFNMHD
jgi:hypothetical protein